MISCFPSTGSIDVCRGSQQFVDLVLYWQWFLGSTHSMLTVVYCIWMESCSSCHGTADLCGGQRLASVVELRAAGTSRCSSSLFVWFLYMKCSSGTLRKEASFLGCLPGLTGNNQTEMPHIVKMSSECSNCSFNGTEQRSQLEAVGAAALFSFFSNPVSQRWVGVREKSSNPQYLGPQSKGGRWELILQLWPQLGVSRWDGMGSKQCCEVSGWL
nr:uncharacterized protein LOC125182451 isoform X2 [Anser cygnoides]